MAEGHVSMHVHHGQTCLSMLWLTECQAAMRGCTHQLLLVSSLAGLEPHAAGTGTWPRPENESPCGGTAATTISPAGTCWARLLHIPLPAGVPGGQQKAAKDLGSPRPWVPRRGCLVPALAWWLGLLGVSQWVSDLWV